MINYLILYFSENVLFHFQFEDIFFLDVSCFSVEKLEINLIVSILKDKVFNWVLLHFSLCL